MVKFPYTTITFSESLLAFFLAAMAFALSSSNLATWALPRSPEAFLLA